jgi:predicted peptidase
MNEQQHVYEKQVTKTVKLNYLLQLPSAYDADPEKRWPLIFFLHGRGERGDDLELVKKHGVPRRVAERDDLPFVVVSPQCPITSWWPVETSALIGLLDDVVLNHRVDTHRLYLTGLSMGGYGAWRLVLDYPERFAALVPICGPSVLNLDNIALLKTMPMWVFHGAKDPTVPIAHSERMVGALREISADDLQYTVYPEGVHDVWTETYNNPALYEWLLEHKR